MRRESAVDSQRVQLWRTTGERTGARVSTVWSTTGSSQERWFSCNTGNPINRKCTWKIQEKWWTMIPVPRSAAVISIIINLIHFNIFNQNQLTLFLITLSQYSNLSKHVYFDQGVVFYVRMSVQISKFFQCELVIVLNLHNQRKMYKLKLNELMRVFITFWPSEQSKKNMRPIVRNISRFHRERLTGK